MSKSISVDFHGYTQEECLAELENQLNLCFQRKVSELEIVHGKGKGILEKAILQYLRSSDLDFNFHTIPQKHSIIVKFNI